jgi:hypothetical protein
MLGYVCYGCGARRTLSSEWEEEWEECCDRVNLISYDVHLRAKKNWRRCSRKWWVVWIALKCLRPLMLERAVERKYAPDGRGAELARAEFESLV